MDWEDYWRQRLPQAPLLGWDPRLCPVEGLKLVQSVPSWRERGVRRVLIAGCGITLVHHALAHCGFEVVALDVSEAATKFLEAHRPTDVQLRYFFQLDSVGNVRDVFEEYGAPGGSAVVVRGDFTNPRCAPGRFELVAAWRCVQHLQGEALTSCIEAIDDRTEGEGIWHFSVQNDPTRWTHVVSVLERRGYVINPTPWPQRRFLVGGVASG